MKFLLLSDCHLLYEKPRARLDDTFQTGLKKMSFVLDYASHNNCTVLTAGDLLDSPRSWYLLVAYMSLFREKDVPIYTIFGQHDQYFRSKKALSLEAFSIAGLVGILDCKERAPFGLVGKINVYGCGYGEEIPEVVNKNNLNILIIHKMIVGKKLWPSQENYIYAEDFLKKHEEFYLILCGDAHQKFYFEKGKRIICNTGPMIRKSVDLWDHEPGFWVYDTKETTMNWVEIPHKPAEEVLSRKHIEDEKQVNKMLENFVQAVGSKEVEVGTSFEDNLEIFIEENKIEEDVVNIISGVMEKEER